MSKFYINNVVRLAVYLLVGMVVGCGGGAKSGSVEGEVLYEPEYATRFVIRESERGGNSTILTVLNPWQGAVGVERSLFLSRDGELPPTGFEGVVVNAPLRSVVCMSSSYVSFIDAVGTIDAVKAVSGARYITNDTIRARYARGEVRDVGYDANVDYELVASLAPDLVMIYGVAGENSTMTDKLSELGINVLYVGEYVEQTPLGKAEWVVAFGEMFDRREQAQEMFTQVRDDYLETCTLVAESGREEPVVMLNAPYRDTWFVPGNGSYMVRLIVDAGGRYVCSQDNSEQSRPISAESAFIYASGADVWLNPGQASTMRELNSMNPRFVDILPVRGGRVFNCTRRSTPDGGSDFWESGGVRPDVVLKDLVRILHPELLPDYELYYFLQLS